MNYLANTCFLTCRSGFSVSLEGDAVKATRLLTLRIDGQHESTERTLRTPIVAATMSLPDSSTTTAQTLTHTP